jgi:hypothetical protein
MFSFGLQTPQTPQISGTPQTQTTNLFGGGLNTATSAPPTGGMSLRSFATPNPPSQQTSLGLFGNVQPIQNQPLHSIPAIPPSIPFSPSTFGGTSGAPLGLPQFTPMGSTTGGIGTNEGLFSNGKENIDLICISPFATFFFLSSSNDITECKSGHTCFFPFACNSSYLFCLRFEFTLL